MDLNTLKQGRATSFIRALSVRTKVSTVIAWFSRPLIQRLLLLILSALIALCLLGAGLLLFSGHAALAVRWQHPQSLNGASAASAQMVSDSAHPGARKKE